MSQLLSSLHTIMPMLARDSSCGTNNASTHGVLPGIYDGLCAGGNVQIEGLNDVFIVIGNVVRILIALSGGLAVIFFIYAAIMYIISTGDPSRIRQAKEILTQAITGLLVILLSYGVVTFLVNQFA